MKQSKFAKARPRRKASRRAVLPLVLIILVFTVSVGGTLAYIIDQTAAVQNSFTPAQVSCRVENDLTITNTSNVKAYIRAMVVVNWVDAQGNVYGNAPAFTATNGSGWEQDAQTGIYYYQSTVPAHDSVSTTDTIPAPANITVTSANPDAKVYTLRIEVVAEAIQAEGMGATGPKNAWEKADDPLVGN